MAEQVARESPVTTEEQAPRRTAYFSAPKGGTPVDLEDADDTTDIEQLPAVTDLIEEELPLDADEAAKLFLKQCEDMATAIDLEKGVEEIIAPWETPVEPEVVIRTLEDSEDESE